MRTIAAVNQKGGSGKTTTAVNIAAALGEKGRKVLVIDLDPQASCSAWLGVKDGGRGLLDMFTDNGNLLDLVHETDAPGVEVIPASSWLSNVEKALAGEVGAELVFQKAVRGLPARWDLVLVDCPPSLGLLTISALAAVREALVAVEAHYMALAGLVQLLRTVDVVKERLNPDLAVSAILACRVDQRTRLSLEVVDRLRERFGKLVLRAFVRENVRLAESPSYAKPIITYDTRSHGAEDYRAVATELWRKGKP